MAVYKIAVSSGPDRWTGGDTIAEQTINMPDGFDEARTIVGATIVATEVVTVWAQGMGTLITLLGKQQAHRPVVTEEIVVEDEAFAPDVLADLESDDEKAPA